MEDRLLTFKQMETVSNELESAGFKHVISRLHIDPEWRASYRPQRPELEPVSWCVQIEEHLLPLPRIKALIEICERHRLVVWMDCAYAEDGGNTLYFKIGNSARVATAYITPNGG